MARRQKRTDNSRGALDTFLGLALEEGWISEAIAARFLRAAERSEDHQEATMLFLEWLTESCRTREESLALLDALEAA